MVSRIQRYFLIVTFCSFLHHFCAEARKTGSQYAVKTIETSNGDVYDCVDFYKQPAFNHPLLKNHSFHPEMRPSSRPKWLRAKKNSVKNDMRMDIRFKEGSCPRGTVPIRRYNENDLLQNKLFQQRYAQLGANSSRDQSDSEDRIYFGVSQSKGDPTMSYYGVGATLAVYNPQVLPSQYSSGEIIVKGGSDAIITGWTVNPGVYKDFQTRFFIYTIAGGSHCFDSQCGFISVRTDIPLDFLIKPVSKMGGPIYELKFFVYQDAKNGNWWLEVGTDYTILGFWPQRIFQGLYDSGSYVACGGEAFRPANTRRPHMGTGYFPKSKLKDYNAYCQDMLVVDKQHNIVYADGYTETFTSEFAQYAAFQGGKHYFIYGGPDSY